jgi:hypothetical protein
LSIPTPGRQTGEPEAAGDGAGAGCKSEAAALEVGRSAVDGAAAEDEPPVPALTTGVAFSPLSSPGVGALGLGSADAAVTELSGFCAAAGRESRQTITQAVQESGPTKSRVIIKVLPS